NGHSAGTGAGLVNYGTSTLTNCTVSGNAAIGNVMLVSSQDGRDVHGSDPFPRDGPRLSHTNPGAWRIRPPMNVQNRGENPLRSATPSSMQGVISSSTRNRLLFERTTVYWIPRQTSLTFALAIAGIVLFAPDKACASCGHYVHVG